VDRKTGEVFHRLFRIDLPQGGLGCFHSSKFSQKALVMGRSHRHRPVRQ
jgi:hypothetical protein